MKTYHGSCECEKVKFEVKLDLAAGTFKCNCRMCTKSRFWGATVEPENLKVLTGENELTTYWKNPIHHFCKHCGVKVFGRGEQSDGKKMIAIALTVLDDLDSRDLCKAPVHYVDGRHDRFDRSPDFTDHL